MARSVSRPSHTALATTSICSLMITFVMRIISAVRGSTGGLVIRCTPPFDKTDGRLHPCAGTFCPVSYTRAAELSTIRSVPLPIYRSEASSHDLVLPRPLPTRRRRRRRLLTIERPHHRDACEQRCAVVFNDKHQPYNGRALRFWSYPRFEFPCVPNLLIRNDGGAPAFLVG